MSYRDAESVGIRLRKRIKALPVLLVCLFVGGMSAVYGDLLVSPNQDLSASGPEGGPFVRTDTLGNSSITYTLTNTSQTPVTWSSSKEETWVSVTPSIGGIPGGQSTVVTVSINESAKLLAGGVYDDIVRFSNVTQGGNALTRRVTLVVSAPSVAGMLVTDSTDFEAAGEQYGPFSDSRSYTIFNSGGVPLNWRAFKVGGSNWLTLSANAGQLMPGRQATVTLYVTSEANTLDIGSYTETVAFENLDNGIGNTTRKVELTILPTTPGVLTVSPATGFTATGDKGGPFTTTPTDTTYTLTNTGGTRLQWTATTSGTQIPEWLTLSATSGSLEPGDSIIISAVINIAANQLGAGNYVESVTFAFNENDSTVRNFSLNITGLPGIMTVSPIDAFNVSISEGVYTPASQTYTISNIGNGSLAWSAALSNSSSWVTLSSTSGELLPSSTATTLISLNQNVAALGEGIYQDTIVFTNVTNGIGTTNRFVNLTVLIGDGGVLTVSPTGTYASTGPVGGPFLPEVFEYTLSNNGTQALTWTATKSGLDWISLSGITGRLEAGDSTVITAAVNNQADLLAIGDYQGSISFFNGTTLVTRRFISINIIEEEALLVVSPITPFATSGTEFGEDFPTTHSITLTNVGGAPLDWQVTKSQSFVTLATTSGRLEPFGTATLIVSVNSQANLLPEGGYSDTLVITNLTNGKGNTNIDVDLTINPVTGGNLEVSLDSALGDENTIKFEIPEFSLIADLDQTGFIRLTNTGTRSLDWTIATSGSTSWLSLAAISGTLAGNTEFVLETLVNRKAEKLVAGTYSATLTFYANGLRLCRNMLP